MNIRLCPDEAPCIRAGFLQVILFLASLTLTACSNTDSTTTSPTNNPIPPASASYILTIAKTGAGTVSSDDGGINCGNTCSASYPRDSRITLSATADTGHTFSGWSGPCTGTSACIIDITEARSLTANFNPSGTVDLNCTGTWAGSEETTTITAWPYRDCFRTDPVAGRRTRITANVGADVAWEQGTGWNGQNALRVRAPDGSPDLDPPDGFPDRVQGYAGLGEHYFHAVRTKRLNIRYLFRYNANWVRYAQGTKWELAIKYDYTNPNDPVRRQGCDRAMTMATSDLLIADRKRFVVSQGVCSETWSVPNQDGFNFGPGVRENEWISVENEFDLQTGWYRTYVTTQDGVYNQSLTSEINIGPGAYGAPREDVPNPYWWGSIDCTAGCFWGWSDDGGTIPRPADTYIWFSHFVMSNTRIGPPAGFVQQTN